ncbi:hypothetical protein ACVMBY_003776 [Bradyrhizobium huanghuaihaiense]
MAAFRETCTAFDADQEQRDRHGDGQQRQRPPHQPPRARSEILQRERGDQPRGENADAGPGVEQAEQEIGPLRARLRDRRGQRAAGDEAGRRPQAQHQAGKAQRDEIARQCASCERGDAGQGSAADRRRPADAPDQPGRHQGAHEIADGVDGVHETGRRVGPAEVLPHVGQHQRIGKAADTEPDRRGQRQGQDQPRGMRL